MPFKFLQLVVRPDFDVFVNTNFMTPTVNLVILQGSLMSLPQEN